MKKYYLLLTLLLYFTTSFAQEQPEKKYSFYDLSYSMRNSGSFGSKAHLLTICYGLPSTLYGEINGAQDPNRFVIGPVKLLYEFSIRDDMGIAPKFLYAYGSWNYTDWLGFTKMRTTAWAVGANGYYHFNKLIPAQRLDLFTGIGFYVGMQTFVWDVSYPSDKDRDIIATPTFSAGARYYFTKGFGAYTEFGFVGGSIVDLGLTFRFN